MDIKAQLTRSGISHCGRCGASPARMVRVVKPANTVVHMSGTIWPDAINTSMVKDWSFAVVDVWSLRTANYTVINDLVAWTTK